MNFWKNAVFALLLTGAVPAPAAPLFEDVTEAVGLAGIGRDGGVTWVDLDGDGWCDLVVQGRIWRNVEGKKFVEVTKESGVPPLGWSATAADFNGDGHIDLVFPNREGALWLGDGRFGFVKGEMAKTPNSHSMGAAAADFDGDGWVDLYGSSYEIWEKQQSFPDFRYRNNRGKLDLAWVADNPETMRSRGGVTAADFNNDGAVDVYVGNYRLQPNFLWVNDGKANFVNRAAEFGAAGTMREDTKFKTELGVEYPCCGHTISAVWGDFDNDGLFDLFVGNFSHPPKYQDRPMFLQNGGPGKEYRFLDRSADAAIPWQESYAGSAAADYDNDGRLDLFFGTIYKGDRGKLFRNEGNWKFSDVPDAGGIQCERTFQAAWADFDNDGRPDLFTGGRLYRNAGPAGNFLRITLADRAPNTAAIGAAVKLTGEGFLSQVRQVEAGTGCGCQNELACHFGLGKAEGEATAEVRWPDGTVERFPGLKANSCYRIARGGKPVPVPVTSK